MRTQSEMEKDEDDATQFEIARSVKKWGRAACFLGLALVVSVGSVVPFLYGHPLHSKWDTFGVGFVVLSMGLLPAFLYASGTTLNLWLYGRSLKKIAKDYAN